MEKTIVKKYFHIAVLSFVIILITILFTSPVFAAPLDEILNYEITADMNEDATVRLTYHIEWKVLDDTSEGDLSWVKIGIPNYHCEEITGLSDAVKEIYYDYDNGYYVRINLDRHYKKDEVVILDFSFIQDNIYKMNEPEESCTTYEFTPGWFDDIPVDKMVIRWDSEKADRWEPSCTVEDGYLVWEYEGLEEGERHPLQIIYPIDAFAFDETKKFEDSDYKEDPLDNLKGIPLAIFGIIGSLVFHTLAKQVRETNCYHNGASFGSGGSKITRTKIVYYDTCPGCGAPREEGKENCQYCGVNMIKLKEVVEEKDLKPGEKESGTYDREGEYRYSDSPNTYMRVHVVPIPVSRGRNSKAFSCVHSSCACACACACAGGGRAGCSTKDFYISVKNGWKLARRNRGADGETKS